MICNVMHDASVAVIDTVCVLAARSHLPVGNNGSSLPISSPTQGCRPVSASDRSNSGPAKSLDAVHCGAAALCTLATPSGV